MYGYNLMHILVDLHCPNPNFYLLLMIRMFVALRLLLFLQHQSSVSIPMNGTLAMMVVSGNNNPDIVYILNSHSLFVNLVTQSFIMIQVYGCLFWRNPPYGFGKEDLLINSHDLLIAVSVMIRLYALLCICVTVLILLIIGSQRLVLC